MEAKIIAAVAKVAKQHYEVYEERWVTAEELCQHVGLLSERWLRENGYPKAYSGNIQSCCAGKYRFVYGAKWRYLWFYITLWLHTIRPQTRQRCYMTQWSQRTQTSYWWMLVHWRTQQTIGWNRTLYLRKTSPITSAISIPTGVNWHPCIVYGNRFLLTGMMKIGYSTHITARHWTCQQISRAKKMWCMWLRHIQCVSTSITFSPLALYRQEQSYTTRSPLGKRWSRLWRTWVDGENAQSLTSGRTYQTSQRQSTSGVWR